MQFLKVKDMKKNLFFIVSEGFGHGMFSELVYKAMANGQIPVAFSLKKTEENFTKEAEQIYNNLHFFLPTLRKATWAEREDILVNGWNPRQSLLNGEFTAEMWDTFAKNKLTPEVTSDLPQFSSLNGKKNIMVVFAKWKTDFMGKLNAKQQSLDPQLFLFLKKMHAQLILGQHFDKVNDLKAVQTLANEFNTYIPGMSEHSELFGIRGIQHKMYWNLYNQLDGCIGIPGTHTWYLLTCFPQVPQIIVYNKNGVEKWNEVATAYQRKGYPIYALGFNEETDMQALSLRMEELANKLF